MLVNIHHDSPREHTRLFVAGVAFLLSIALLIWFSIALYNKEFTDATRVTVQAERAGLQLAKFGDVRLNGARVGYVEAVGQNGENAEITVALEPAAAEEIPGNVEVDILPTTLFGQKFIAFVRPDVPAGRLGDGDVIPLERVETNVELSRILNDLFPLLRAVRPADLNATLGALAQALEGRGEQIGQTMDQLESYLGELNDQLPTLREDLIALADVADAYDLAAPDLLDALDNVTVTAKTVVEKRDDLDTFFSDIAGLSRTSTRVLADNEQNLIRMGEVTAPVLQLLAEYSPEFPCLIRGAANYEPILSKTFENDWVKQYIELFTPQYRAWDERDLPTYGEVGHGPWCAGLPGFQVPATPRPLDQGTNQDEISPSAIPNFGLFDPIGDIESGTAGTNADQRVLNAMLAGANGHEEPETYGALGSLLYGPVVREGRSAE
ncbi:MCE family protein [Nocardioides panacisoli]|uniref:MCE family protein n=1 Tax=Nocardioides panacisoli TaxID=627624 RepID=UPI001C6370FE|nr:MCE family protein [Nocardioides panacisoli]QYJ04875.1 MCE family protein [Nocardioides panacisoli]